MKVSNIHDSPLSRHRCNAPIRGLGDSADLEPTVHNEQFGTTQGYEVPPFHFDVLRFHVFSCPRANAGAEVREPVPLNEPRRGRASGHSGTVCFGQAALPPTTLPGSSHPTWACEHARVGDFFDE